MGQFLTVWFWVGYLTILYLNIFTYLKRRGHISSFKELLWEQNEVVKGRSMDCNVWEKTES